MKIVQINTVYAVGSTGKMVKHLQADARARGHESVACYRFHQQDISKDAIPVSSWLDCHIHNRLAMITGLQGCFSRLRTWTFLRKLRKYAPDLIHLHNLHGSYIHHGLLFKFIKKHKIPVVWTLHDCWSFTGGCPHFVGYACEKWKNGCGSCPHFAQNAGTWFDTSISMWKRKKRWFTNVSDMTLVCPSKWLANLAGESFLKDYPIQVIANGIDIEMFRPTEGDFRSRYSLEDKKLVLGVSYDWNTKKGLDTFVKLAKQIPENYRIILVGTNEKIDAILPENIVSIHRTANQQEMAEIYTAADVFVNPSREENYPTVNMEALACGTPVVTFRTGGSPESIDTTCGCVVDVHDIDALEKAIIRVCEEKPYPAEACLKKAAEHDHKLRYKEYMELYERINASRNQTNRT